MRNRNLVAWTLAAGLLTGCSNGVQHRVEGLGSDVRSLTRQAGKTGLQALRGVNIGIDNVQATRDARGQHGRFELGNVTSTFKFTSDAAVIHSGFGFPGLLADFAINGHCENGDLRGTISSHLGQTIFNLRTSGVHIRPNFQVIGSELCDGNNLKTAYPAKIISVIIGNTFSR